MNTVSKVDQIIIADSQFLVVEGIKSLLERENRYSILGAADTKKELLKLLEKMPCGLLIVDFATIDLDGFNDLEEIRVRFPDISLLILTNSVSKAEFAGLSKLGIKNIIYKSTDKDEFLSAIESALRGKKCYSDEILDLLMDQNGPKATPDVEKPLTASEIEIVKLIADGLTTKEIASKRNISYHTVNTHRKNIFRKVDVSNASELILHAIKAGWIDNIEYYI